MAIELSRLSKSYQELSVFADFSLTFAEKKVSAILGPSGCGKTTLLDLIAGTLAPDRGSISGVEGRRIGYVFQEPRLLPWLTVRGNIEFVLREIFGEAERREIVERWLTLVGLEEFSGYYPAALSGGMRQRVAIARAFAVPSTLLLLDEPFQALDLKRTLSLIEVFDSLWRIDRRTTIFVTHDLREALLLADDLFVLSERPSSVLERLRLSGEHNTRSLEDSSLLEIQQRLYRMLT